MAEQKGSTSKGVDIHVWHKEWDEISCPICMEHPHNAVLLICSSHEKGCRSYICDTSYRHSNCLDRFRKMKENLVQPRSTVHDNFSRDLSDQRNLDMLSEPLFRGLRMRRNLVETHEVHTFEENVDEITAGLFDALEDSHNPSLEAHAEERVGHEESAEEKLSELKCLKCPLCRGTVLRWVVVKEARQYWDLKPRSCSRESCSFSGNYRELRRHARGVHPAARPADVDPVRQQAWRHLENQQEHGDIISAIRSAMPGAIVLGDYVFDSGDGLPHGASVGSGEASRPLWSTFFLFHMISSPNLALAELTGSPRGWRRRRRPSGENHNLWGERLLGLAYSDDDDDDDDDNENPEDDDFLIPRRRRRIARSRSDEDNS